MRYLFDIDDTLAICTPQWTRDTEVYMRDHGFKRIRPPEEDVYDLALSFDIDESNKDTYYKTMMSTFIFGSLLPVPGAREYIAQLIDNNDVVEFITNRGTQQYSITADWIRKNFAITSPVIHYKAFVDDLHPDVLIDNSEKRIKDAQNRGIFAILFTGVEVEREEVSDISGLIQAKSFAEIPELIDKEMKKNG